MIDQVTIERIQDAARIVMWYPISSHFAKEGRIMSVCARFMMITLLLYVSPAKNICKCCMWRRRRSGTFYHETRATLVLRGIEISGEKVSYRIRRKGINR